MFNKVIVGVDGQEGGADAVALARFLAAPDGEIVLVNAFPYEDERPSEGALKQFEDLLRSESLERLHAAGDDARFTFTPVPSISPARALHEEAERAGADLIVVGSCHRGTIGRALLGDVSRSVLHGATCPVAVAPRGRRDLQEIRTIGVGVDQSPAAQAAVALAAQLAGKRGAQVRLVAAVQEPIPFAPAYAYTFDWTEMLAEQRKVATQLLEAMVAGLDVPASFAVVDGSPAERLEELTKEVDLLVLGSRGWGAVRRVVLGSTADRVIHSAACPVVLAPAPAR